MLIAAAVCPHPPLLVPEMAGEAASELDSLRSACDRAVAALLSALRERPDAVLVVVGGGAETRRHERDAAGGLQPYGLDLTVGAGEPVLPLSLTIGRWLLGRSASGSPAHAPEGPRVSDGTGATTMAKSPFAEIAGNAPATECLLLGRRLAEGPRPLALLVMGDGSACRTVQAPGYLDERAAPYDADVVRALAEADAAALAALDPRLSGELQAAGRAAWQVLAGAAEGAAPRFAGEVLYDEAPYGVGYFVATWTEPSAARPQ